MSTEMSTNMSVFLQAVEKEARTLKAITNLRTLGPKCSKDVVAMLQKVEKAVQSVESSVNELDCTLDRENASLDENMEQLQRLAEQQGATIAALRGEMPTFMGPMLEVGAAATKYRPVEAVDFSRVPVSTRGRQTYEQVNESFGCIYKLVSEKTAALGTAAGRKALGKGALLEIESLKHADHKGSVFLSEVELRSTAIFASGETTGRAILHTLRALQRIRVIRSGGENTFVLL